MRDAQSKRRIAGAAALLGILGLAWGLRAEAASLPAASPGSPPAKPARAPVVKDGMAFLTGGQYRPLYLSEDSPVVEVDDFWLDVEPVSNKEFAAFVGAHPKWGRARAPKLFADPGYLGHWRLGSASPGSDDHASGSPSVKQAGSAPLRQDWDKPVTRVSWYAADAYCRSLGKRLPTVAEWEYAGSASQTDPMGSREPGYTQTILEWYARPAGDSLPDLGQTPPNYWGARDMHGVVWEWVDDFNSALVTGDEGQTRALANALNIQYRRLKDGEVAHSNTITLLDEEGRIETQAAGLRSAMRKILNALGATESNAPAVKPVKADAASSKSVKP